MTAGRSRLVCCACFAGAKASDQRPPSAALHSLQPDSTLGKKKPHAAERQVLADRGATATPMAALDGMHADLPPAGPQQAAQGGEKSKKKRKRLTKAADMLPGPQSMDVEQPATTSLQVGLVSLQYCWLAACGSMHIVPYKACPYSGFKDASHFKHQIGIDIIILVAPHEVFRCLPASSSGKQCGQHWCQHKHCACMQAAGLTDESDEEGAAAARGHKAQKNAAGGRHPTAAHPSTTSAPSQQPAMLNGYQHRADSLGAEGRTSFGGQDAPTNEAAAAQPAGPKVRLKIRWSAGSEDYDDSWFVQHVDRQPLTYGPVSSLSEVSMHAMHEVACHDRGSWLSGSWCMAIMAAFDWVCSSADSYIFQNRFVTRLYQSKTWARLFSVQLVTTSLTQRAQSFHLHVQPCSSSQVTVNLTSCLQFEEMVREYDRKHNIYFKLHQEIQDLSTKVEGLQQVSTLCSLLYGLFLGLLMRQNTDVIHSHRLQIEYEVPHGMHMHHRSTEIVVFSCFWRVLAVSSPC